jgi:hypothetical protein
MTELFPEIESQGKKVSRLELLLLDARGLSPAAKKLLRRAKKRKTQGARNKTAQTRVRGLQYRLFAEVRRKPLINSFPDPLDQAGNTERFGSEDVRWICEHLLDRLQKLFIKPLIAGHSLSTREHMDWWTWLLDDSEAPFSFQHCLQVTGTEPPIFFRRESVDIERITLMPEPIKRIFRAPASERNALIETLIHQSLDRPFGLA